MAFDAATEVVRTFAFDALTIRLPKRAVAGLERSAGIRYVEENGTMEALSQTLPWGIDRIDAEVAHANGETGAGADIAVIDTGIDGDHPDLQANVGAGKAFVDCRPLQGRPNGCRYGSRTNDNPCNYAWSDDNNHGTHCAGIADAVDNTQGVVGVSTEATLHAVKVLDYCGSGTFSDVAAGIEYTADQGWDVGSLSLGGGKSQAVEDAVEYAYGKGVLLVAAAGNDGPCTDCVSYPAAEPEVVAVSATTENDQLANFSSQGPEVELAAPGTDIYSTVYGGYAYYGGTSMACPHVSGTGGQLMANGYTNTEARDRLHATAEDIGLSDDEQGYGLVDTAAALGLDSSDST
ncbi:S8 family peptidase [Halorussus caseinilyticus]|uniref:S8 family peptidase n=1 Tax=Halorussus caseinilyticus TaxID=3034025 RepID=A0ABD5WLM4_9EURY